MDSWVGMDCGDDISEYATVGIPVGCRSVRLPTSPDYTRNVPIMLESVPIMLALCIFPRPYYARHYAGIIRPSLTPPAKKVKGSKSYCRYQKVWQSRGMISSPKGPI